MSSLITVIIISRFIYSDYILSVVKKWLKTNNLDKYWYHSVLLLYLFSFSQYFSQTAAGLFMWRHSRQYSFWVIAFLWCTSSLFPSSSLKLPLVNSCGVIVGSTRFAQKHHYSLHNFCKLPTPGRVNFHRCAKIVSFARSYTSGFGLAATGKERRDGIRDLQT